MDYKEPKPTPAPAKKNEAQTGSLKQLEQYLGLSKVCLPIRGAGKLIERKSNDLRIFRPISWTN